MTILKLGLPSKGRLQKDVFEWFAHKGLLIERIGNEREYAAHIIGVEEVELVLLSASEIPKELSKGRIHLGVTGLDLIQEKIPHYHTKIDVIEKMGIGRADLIIAVPKFWVDVNYLDDLDDVANWFRETHKMRLRIATKYHNIIRNYLQKEGLANYQLVDSQGATEGTIKNETAEAIADITSSGSTLDANHLKALADPPILQSEACLCRSKTANWTDVKAHKELADRMNWL